MATETMGRMGATESMHRPDRGMQSSAERHSEGSLAKAIEEQTAKLPSDVFLWAAGASIITSLAFKMMDKDHRALFVGQWAPTFLLLGLYNKIVKVAGSDKQTP